MDDINKRLQQAGRQAARTQQARVDADAAERQAARDAEEPREPPAGTGRLVLERRQGEWRYYLGAHRIRGGDAVDFYVDARVGWVRGRFQWGRRNTSPPSIRVRSYHPDDPTVFLGELDVSLAPDAICRWPTE